MVSSKIVIGAGSGEIKILIPENVRFRVVAAEGVRLEDLLVTGEGFSSSDYAHISENFNSSNIKLEIVTGFMGNLEISRLKK